MSLGPFSGPWSLTDVKRTIREADYTKHSPACYNLPVYIGFGHLDNAKITVKTDRHVLCPHKLLHAHSSLFSLPPSLSLPSLSLSLSLLTLSHSHSLLSLTPYLSLSPSPCPIYLPPLPSLSPLSLPPRPLFLSLSDPLSLAQAQANFTY